MKTVVRIFLLGVLLLAVPAFAEDATPQVVIDKFAYAPTALTVAAGTKVTWVNKDDTPHTVVENNKKFRSAALDTGDSYSYTFTEPGTYHYFCTFHPKMVGTVTVTAKN